MICFFCYDLKAIHTDDAIHIHCIELISEKSTITFLHSIECVKTLKENHPKKKMFSS